MEVNREISIAASASVLVHHLILCRGLGTRLLDFDVVRLRDGISG